MKWLHAVNTEYCGLFSGRSAGHPDHVISGRRHVLKVLWPLGRRSVIGHTFFYLGKYESRTQTIQIPKIEANQGTVVCG